MAKTNPKAKNSNLVSVPVPIFVINNRQKLRDKMPQQYPKVKPEAWHDVTKQPMLQKPNPNLEAKMPSVKMPAEDRHGHHQGEAKQAKMAVAPPEPEIEDEKNE